MCGSRSVYTKLVEMDNSLFIEWLKECSLTIKEMGCAVDSGILQARKDEVFISQNSEKQQTLKSKREKEEEKIIKLLP